MSPEATFVTSVVNGQIPFGVGLLLILAFVIWRGGLKLDKLTTAVEAVPLALTAHKAETTSAIGDLRAHTTAQADRVIAVIEDRRLSEVGDALDGVTRAVSAPEATELPRRQPTGRHAAAR